MGQIFILKMRKLEPRDGNLLTVMFFKGIYVTRFLGFPITVRFYNLEVMGFLLRLFAKR